MLTAPAEVSFSTVYRATREIGAYNHAAMIDARNGSLFLAWKNSPVDEDTPGQRVLFAQSTDGDTWTPTDGKTNVLFPNVSSAQRPAALFAGPFAMLNGRRYATASPHQFCLFPYPYARTPTAVDPANVLLMREVGLGAPVVLGPIFWASAQVPAGFEQASARENIVGSSAMGAVVQGDLARLADAGNPPCDDSDGMSSKCEACVGGCGNATRCERTHYTVPGGGGNVILQRTKDRQLAYSVRPANRSGWSDQFATTIPDINANLNAGTLPGGRVFLASNPCPKNGQGHGRDPLVISSSADGWVWDRATGVMSCEQLGQCGPRIHGKAKDSGPSYPQAIAVVAPKELEGLYVVATNNKEDVVVARVRAPFGRL